jgi:hypothetical protein
MCFIVVPLTPLRKLVAAAQNVQALIDDGTIPAAFTNPSDHATTLAITAFDVLATNAASVGLQLGGVSPFLRYRREILADGESGHGLRKLWANLFGGRQGLNLSYFFMNADEHHTRIALDLIASYTKLGENDPHFMALVDAPAMWPVVETTSSEGSAS